MSDTPMQLTIFDYAALDTETRIRTQKRTSKIKALMRRSATDIIEIGQELIASKADLDHGQFMGWIKVEFDWSWDTAKRFMRVAEKFQNQQIADFAPSALYLLAAPSTPEPARAEALERAEAGEPISYTTAREIVNGYRTAPEPRHDDGEDVDPLPFDPLYDDPPSTETRQQHVMRVMGSSESPEWYTPREVVDRVLALFGEIDLDPCSNSHEAPNVPARQRYTKEDDGLTQPWACNGKVYMNPPYGTEIGKWTVKLVAAYESGEIDEAIALLPGRIDTAWFQPLYNYLMCNVRGRLQFSNAEYSAPFPSVIVYLGIRPQAFIDVFKDIGPIVQRIA